jgi:transposase
MVENQSGQNSVESGFRFLKDPAFLMSSLFVKKSSRVQGLPMVMTLSLLVYSIAKRRLRKKPIETETTLSNQIKKERKCKSYSTIGLPAPYKNQPHKSFHQWN